MTHQKHILDAITVETKPNPDAAIIWLHGLGADAQDFVDIIPMLQLPPQLAIRFIFPNAPVRPVSLNQGFPCRAWYDLYSITDLSREDEAGIKAMQKIIDGIIENEIKLGISSDRIILAGFSQGGAMALYNGVRQQHSLGGILALSTYMPLPHQLITEVHVANQQTPILQIHGDQDAAVPLALAHRTAQLLQQAGFNVDWQVLPMAHEVIPQEIKLISNWLTGILSGQT